MVLKKVSAGSPEIHLAQWLSTPERLSDKDNHCVPILDVLSAPDAEDEVILVMPLLRKFNDPPFDTYGEVVECLQQLFAVNQFHTPPISQSELNTFDFMILIADIV